MGRGRRGIRVIAAAAVLLLMVGTLISFFLPPDLPEEYEDALPEGYSASDSAKDPWLSVEKDGTVRVHPERCVHLSELEIPEVVNGIKVTAFYCTTEESAPWIKRIVFPSTITAIGAFPLHKWNGLEEIVFKEGLEDLSETFLMTKPNLKKLVLPSSLKTLNPEFLKKGADALVIHFGGTEEEWLALGKGATALSEKYTVIFESNGNK